MQYADDLDFISTSKEYLESIHDICSSSLPEKNLKVNVGKTERTEVFLSKDTEEKGKENWRKAKSLGSLLDSSADIERRVELPSIAMKKLKGFWGNRKVSNKLKIKLYNAYVKSILLYNCGKWSGAPNLMKRLDVVHRRHLRNLADIVFPNRISNENLYKLFQEKHLSQEVEKSL